MVPGARRKYRCLAAGVVTAVAVGGFLTSGFVRSAGLKFRWGEGDRGSKWTATASHALLIGGGVLCGGIFLPDLD